VGSIPSVGSAKLQIESLPPQITAKKWQAAVSAQSGETACSAPMKSVIQQINHHMVGHCDCFGGYRTLGYFDNELGCLCLRCIDHLMVADIELNHGGYALCRPKIESSVTGIRR
jgi:hypothetical protein